MTIRTARKRTAAAPNGDSAFVTGGRQGIGLAVATRRGPAGGADTTRFVRPRGRTREDVRMLSAIAE